MATYTIEIPLKLPSCNEYIFECRRNKYAGAKMKREVEDHISFFLTSLPKFNNPVRVAFHWIEENKRRDLDGIAFGKKFILDAMVSNGVIVNDNRKNVMAFTDTFDYGKEAKVILDIEEITIPDRSDYVVYENTIGAKIRKRLDETGMSQSYLAKNIGVSDSTMSKYVWDTFTPNPYRLYAISKVLSVTMEYFFEED